MKLHPFDKVIATARTHMLGGAKIHLQFNCEKCGVKQTFEEENYLSREGRCEECGHITSLEKNGCNLMVIWGN